MFLVPVNSWSWVGSWGLFLLLLMTTSVVWGEGGGGDFDFDMDIDDKLADDLDVLVLDLQEKYEKMAPENFWHPYVYGTDNEVRETLHVKSVGTEVVAGEFLQWKYARLGLKHYVVGLKRRELQVLGSEFQGIASESAKAEDWETFTVFTQWNEVEGRSEMVILAVSSEPRLYVYLFEGRAIRLISTFPVNYALKSVEYCHAGLSSKVVLIPRDPYIAIDIYNVEVTNSTQVWFFQRLEGTLAKEEVHAIVYDSEMLESVIGVVERNRLNIYTFDTKAGMFLVSQIVELPSECRSLFSFTLAFQHYIGCVPVDPDFSVRLVSFNYDKNEYVLEEDFDGFKNARLTSVYPIAVPEYTDQYFMLVRDADGVIHILVYQGRQLGFHAEYNCTYNGCPTVSDLQKGAGFRLKDDSTFIFPSPDQDNSVVWLITKEIKDSMSPLVDESLQLYHSYKELSEKFIAWEKNVTDVEKALNGSIKPDEANVVQGTWDVEKLVSTRLDLDGKKGSNQAINELKFSGSPWLEEDYNTDLKEVWRLVNALKKDISTAKSQLDHAIFQDVDGVQRVEATQRVSGLFQSHRLVSRKIKTKSLADGQNVPEFFDQFLVKSKEIQMSGELLMANLSLSQLQTPKLNGILLTNVARYSQENKFECPVQFIQGLSVYGNIDTPTINGVRLAEDVMLASDITGVNFLDGIVVENNTDSKGEYSFSNVLLKSSSQVVESAIYFESLNIPSPIQLDMIKGYSFNQFAAAVVTPNFEGVISGTKTVSGVVQAKSLKIGSKWNNVTFPDGIVRNQQSKVILNAPSAFERITSEKVGITGTLNNAKVDDYVSRTSRQDILGTWTFSGLVSVIKDMAVKGLVDGVDMTVLGNKATLNSFGKVGINADVEFDKNVTFENLKVAHSINGKNFYERFGDILLFNGTHCEIPGMTTIATNLTLDSMTVDKGLINDQRMDGFFLVVGDQNITENVEISEKCSFNSLIALKSFDGVDLKQLLDKAVRLTGSNKIPWEAEFEHIKCGSEMEIIGPINGFENFGNNIAVTSGRKLQEFIEDIEFEHLVMDTAAVEDDMFVGEEQVVGGLKLVQWYSRRHNLGEDTDVTSYVTLNGRASVTGDAYIPIVNNYTLKTLHETSLRSDATLQKFYRHVALVGGLNVDGSLTFDDTIDGHNLNSVVEYAFPLNSTELLELTGDWSFESITTPNALEVKGSTCGVDLEDFVSNTLRKSGTNIDISEMTHFKELHIINVANAATINGRNTDNLFTLNTDQIVVCPFSSTHSLKVNGNLQTNGIVNGVSTDMLTKLYHFSIKNNTHIINSDYALHHNLTTDKLLVGGQIQGRDFNSPGTTQGLIKVNDANLKFTGTKTFSSRVVIGKNSQTESYNGMSTDTLKFRTLDEDITVLVPIKFSGVVNSRTMNAKMSDVVAESVVGISWESTFENSIPIGPGTYAENLGNLSFDSVIVFGHVTTDIFQQHHFNDFFKISDDQQVGSLQARKVVMNMDSLTVEENFDGHNLQEEFDKTVKLQDVEDAYEPLELRGNTSFFGTLLVEGDITCFGSSFKDDVIDITQPIRIKNSLELSDQMRIEKGLDVSDKIQGYTVGEIMEDAFTTTGNRSITGEWKFVKPVTFKDNVYGPKDLKNFDLQSLVNQTDYHVRAAEEKINSQKLYFKEECRKVHNVTTDLLLNPMKLDAFDKQQTIVLTEKMENLISVQSQSTPQKLVLLTSTPDCGITKYVWQNNSELFRKEELSLNLGRIRDWQSAVNDDHGILVFSTNPSDCSTLQPGIYFTVMDSMLQFSRPQLILYGEITNFHLISDSYDQHTALFVATKDGGLETFLWNSHLRSFSRISKNIPGIYTQVEATQHKYGIAVLLVGHTQFAVWHFNWQSKAFTRLALHSFLSSDSGPAVVFDNLGALFVFVSEKGLEQAEFYRSSVIQVFSLVNNSFSSLQQFPYNGVTQKSIISFSRNTFVGLLSKNVGLNILKFKGLSGFQPLNENPIKLFDGIRIITLNVEAWAFSARRPFLAVLTSRTIELYHSNVYGDSLDYSSRRMCH